MRLLEWKIRFDLLQYAARACAPISLEKITSYVPKDKTRKPTAGKLFSHPPTIERKDHRKTEKKPHSKSLANTPNPNSPSDLLPRIFALQDDGHVSKLIRAIGVCRDASAAHGEDARLKIRGDDLWTKLNQLVVDSVEGGGPTWVRGAGDPGAWTV